MTSDRFLFSIPLPNSRRPCASGRPGSIHCTDVPLLCWIFPKPGGMCSSTVWRNDCFKWGWQ